jgi:hypothetical protein
VRVVLRLRHGARPFGGGGFRGYVPPSSQLRISNKAIQGYTETIELCRLYMLFNTTRYRPKHLAAEPSFADGVWRCAWAPRHK